LNLCLRNLLLALCLAAAIAASTRTVAAEPPLPPPHHVHLFPPVRTGLRNATPPVNLQYYGGPVIHAGTMYLIYWLPPGFFMSPAYQTLINRYFTDVGATPLFNIVTQYPDGSGPPLNASTLGGTWVDTASYPRAGTTADPLLDSDIGAEVLHAIATHPGWNPPGPNTAYFVFTARDVHSCIDASKTACFLSEYCAYHGSFVSGGVTVLYNNMPDAGTNLSGCSVGTGPNGDPEADAEISLISHEHFEVVTDPQPNVATAWSDVDGFEIADKCAYTYGALNADNSNVVLHGHPYRVQQEWSNLISACTLSLPSSVGGISEPTGLTRPSPGRLTGSPVRARGTRETDAVVAALTLVVGIAWAKRPRSDKR